MAKVPSEFRKSFGGVENFKFQISVLLLVGPCSSPLQRRVFFAVGPKIPASEEAGYSKPFAHAARDFRKIVR
jgi:hypothetical protein